MKMLIGNNYGSYSFNPVAKTITIAGINDILKVENLLLITNVTSNIIIYNFSSSAKGATLVDNVINLTFDTATMSVSDSLQILVDVPNPDSELLKTLYKIQRLLEPLSHIDPLTAAQKVSVFNTPNIGTVSTVTAVTSITNAITASTLNALNGVDPRFLLQDQTIQAFNSGIRSRYTFT